MYVIMNKINTIKHSQLIIYLPIARHKEDLYLDKFTELGISGELASKLERQGIFSPTPVQKMAIPKILAGKDLMAEAQTGTGKTLAFLLPMFDSFESKHGHVQGLVLTPTRELAMQIASEAKILAEGGDRSIMSIFGGRDIGKQLRKLSGKVDLVVATPGRLIDHMRRGSIDLAHLKFLVLDEADQMLYIGFRDEIEMILKATNKDKQLLCFSATLDSKVKKLAYRHMNSPLELSVEKESVTLEGIRQKVVHSSDRWKQEALFGELDKTKPFMAIIFCRTKRRADKLEEEMAIRGYDCRKLHGGIAQNARTRVMKEFRNLKFQYLIATDVAARGLDITGITHIYNFDIPESPETYIHRIGRTGRMGQDGAAVTFASPRDEERLLDIEKAIKMKIPREEHVHGPNETSSGRGMEKETKVSGKSIGRSRRQDRQNKAGRKKR